MSSKKDSASSTRSFTQGTSPTGGSLRVFVSYSHEDRELFSILRTLLEKECGHQVLSDHDIMGGQPFTDAIKGLISHAHIFLPLITRSAQQRPWVHQETGYAMARNVPVYSVVLSDAGMPAEMTSQLQAVVVRRESFKSDLKKKLMSNPLTALVTPRLPGLPEMIQVAEWPEQRSELMAAHGQRVLDLGYHGCVRQMGAFSSFSIPDAPIDHEQWDARDGRERRSQFARHWLRAERQVLERHALQEGCRLILHPWLNPHAHGPKGHVTRLRILLGQNKETDYLKMEISTPSVPVIPTHPKPSNSMAKPRVFSNSGGQSGTYHIVSRIVDRQFRLGDDEKEAFVGMMKAFAAFHQVEILTYCVMGNHFHLLLRVPERAEGFDLSYEAVMELWEAAVGTAWNKGVKRQFEIFDLNGSGEAGREEWRQQMLARMFSMSAFMKSLKQRFTAWYNRRNGRVGTLWEGRYKSVIVEDEARALRMMATYIDLNPVRAGMVEDPGEYRWSGYAEAMAGKAEALEGIAQITGTSAERVHGRGLGEAAPVESPAQRKRRQLRALIHYRQMLGVAGRERVREDGKVVRRGVSAKVQARLDGETGVRREQLMRRVRHFTDGVILGSRAFINGWFERNREWFRGKSRTERTTGARKIGKDWKDVYNLRQLRH